MSCSLDPEIRGCWQGVPRKPSVPLAWSSSGHFLNEAMQEKRRLFGKRFVLNQCFCEKSILYKFLNNLFDGGIFNVHALYTFIHIYPMGLLLALALGQTYARLIFDLFWDRFLENKSDKSSQVVQHNISLSWPVVVLRCHSSDLSDYISTISFLIKYVLNLYSDKSDWANQISK